MTDAPSPAAALWRLLPGLVLAGATLLLFRDTAEAMVAIWRRSDTFAHAFLVAPISAWLVWRQRAELVTLPRRSEPLALVAAAVVCLLWLLGELAAVRAATQFALVALLVLTVPAVFGRHVARALAFPLSFLFFSVPIGEFMVPPMIGWTADFTVAALRLSGIPVYREGMQFVIPSGQWSVVEACSGVRYLIASFMVGTLFAYLNYRSVWRRAAFMLLSLAVPVVANWIRAYLIVLVGHLSSNQLATGVDHLVYGWLFFGVVMAAMFAIGMRWSEPDPAPRLQGADAAPAALRAVADGRPLLPPWLAGVAMLAMMVMVRAYAGHLTAEPLPPSIALELPAAPAGWTRERDAPSWAPAYRNARVSAVAGYTAGAQRVDVWVGHYRGQDEEHKLVTSGNRVAADGEDGAWRTVAQGRVVLALGGESVALRTATVRASGAVHASGVPTRRVWHAYRIGGRFVTGDAEAALRIALRRLLGQGDGAGVIFFSTEPASDTPAGIEQADAALASFVQAQAAPIVSALDRL